MRRSTLLLGMLALGLVASPSPAMAANKAVTVGDNFYAPERVAVVPGEMVTWTHTMAFEEHNVHLDNEASPLLAPSNGDWTQPRTFSSAGAYRYHCDVHGPSMSGVVYANSLGKLPASVKFSASPNPAETGQAVNFDAAASAPGESAISKLQWDFDGNGSFDADTGTARTVSHTYASAGTYDVKLKITDANNLTDERTVAVRVDPPPPPPPPPPGSSGGGAAPIFTAPTAIADTTGPSVSEYGMTNNAFQAGKGSTPATGKAAKAASGTTFKYTLSEAATVKIDLQQLLPGRKKGKACVKPTAKLKKAKKCVRAASQGSLIRTSHAGANTVAFSGRVGSRALKPGGYQAVLTATDGAGNASARKTLSFKVVRR